MQKNFCGLKILIFLYKNYCNFSILPNIVFFLNLVLEGFFFFDNYEKSHWTVNIKGYQGCALAVPRNLRLLTCCL